MKLVYLFFIFSISAFAEDSFDQKKGVTFGLGAGMGSYSFPVQFNGETKRKIDDSATLIGPVLGVGYDVILIRRFLLGLRIEGFVLDSLGSGAKENDKVTDKLNGKISGGTASLRAGWVADLNFTNPIGHKINMFGEIFVEAGLTKGHKRFSKSYYTTEGVTESYSDNLQEDYQGRVFALGFNVTSMSGTFFEIKGVQTSILKNKQTFSGAELVNGGSLAATNKKLKDENKTGMSAILLSIGKHY